MTYSVLGTSVLTVLSRRSIRRRQVASDMVAYAICLSIQHYLPEAREVWAFCFALGYTTWNLLPGSFTSLNLPSHSAFMKGLQKQEKQAECIVCWGKYTLAQLPCSHGTCESCLQLMGQPLSNSVPDVSETFVWFHALACPDCYEERGDILDNSHTSLSAFRHTRGLPSSHRNTAVWMGCFYINVFFLQMIVTRMVIPRREDWWHPAAGQVRSGNVCVSYLEPAFSQLD